MLLGDQMDIIYTARIVGRGMSWPATEYMLRRALEDAALVGATVTVNERGEKRIRYPWTLCGLIVDYEPI